MFRERMLALVLSTLASSCAQGREYELRGQIVALNPERREVTIKHEDIRGFMPGMTMPFKVRDARLMDGRTPGDLVRATLIVENDTAYLSDLERTGHTALTEAPASPLPDLLEPGDNVPDARFVDHSGTLRQFSSWHGRIRLVTFMYTRCPVPNFCPLMDRHFAAVQRAIAADATLSGRVHLISVTIDPAFDTASVLAAHAARLGADATRRSFLTGEPEDIERFASRFGVSILKAGKTSEIVHNLRTAVIDAGGRVVRVFGGNDWTPEQVLAELKTLAVR